MSGLRYLLRKSQRRLLLGLVLLVVSGISLVYIVPGFGKAARYAFNASEPDPEWPMPARQALEAMNRALWDDFYRWTAILGLAILVLAAGAHLSRPGLREMRGNRSSRR